MICPDCQEFSGQFLLKILHTAFFKQPYPLKGIPVFFLLWSHIIIKDDGLPFISHKLLKGSGGITIPDKGFIIIFVDDSNVTIKPKYNFVLDFPFHQNALKKRVQIPERPL